MCESVSEWVSMKCIHGNLNKSSESKIYICLKPALFFSAFFVVANFPPFIFSFAYNCELCKWCMSGFMRFKCVHSQFTNFINMNSTSRKQKKKRFNVCLLCASTCISESICAIGFCKYVYFNICDYVFYLKYCSVWNFSFFIAWYMRAHRSFFSYLFLILIFFDVHSEQKKTQSYLFLVGWWKFKQHWIF